MAYQWKKSSIVYTSVNNGNVFSFRVDGSLRISQYSFSINQQAGVFDYSNSQSVSSSSSYSAGSWNLIDTSHPDVYYNSQGKGYNASNGEVTTYDPGSFSKRIINATVGEFVEYVYSSDENAYPNGGASGGYWYSERTEILPSAPGSITVPTVTAGQPVDITWTAATVENVTISSYILQRSVNGSGWTQVFNGNALTYTDTIGEDWGTVAYQVCAVDNYGGSGPFTTSETQTVQNGILYISGPAPTLGQQITPFAVSFTTGVSGDTSTVSTVLTVSLDGNQIYNETVNTGVEVTLTIDPRVIGGGTHTINANATATDYISASQSYTFTTQSFTLPDGGLGTQLQDNEGNVIFPQSVASLIGGLYGQSVAANLQTMARGILYNSVQIPKYQEVAVDLSTAQVGDIVNLPYNGQMVPHIVVQIGNPDLSMYDASCDGVWLLSKEVIDSVYVWDNSGTYLPSSSIMATMATYLNNYDIQVQNEVKEVKIPYCVGNGSSSVNSGANGLSCKIFPLGGYETGYTTNDSSYVPVDGSKLDYFQSGSSEEANKERIAYKQDNTAVNWYLRSTSVDDNPYLDVLEINSSGIVSPTSKTSGAYYRPCFIMPTTFSATFYVGPDGIHDSQEYINGNTFTDYFGNDIPVPKVEVGSYVGTGQYGQSNPNKIAISKTPNLVIVTGTWGAASHNTQNFSAILNPAATGYGFPASSYTSSDVTGTISVTEDFFQWYSTNGAESQGNLSGITYNYIIFYQ